MRGLRVSLLALALIWPMGTMAGCRLALLLALDVSGSVDQTEYRLQLDGLAAALSHPDVRRAFLSNPAARVELAVLEWSGPEYQRLLQGWTVIASDADLDSIATGLRNTERQPAPVDTALGSAMLHGAALLADRAHCWRQTLDISGDGKQNTGPHPRDAKRLLETSGLTINALVIGTDSHLANRRQNEIGELVSYFNAWVILGPDAFVETALGFQDYEAAMIRKLLRELETLTLSELWGHAHILRAFDPTNVNRCSVSDRTNIVRPGAGCR